MQLQIFLAVSPPPQLNTLADAHLTCNVLFCMSNMHVYQPGKSSVVFLDCQEKGTMEDCLRQSAGERVLPRGKTVKVC